MADEVVIPDDLKPLAGKYAAGQAPDDGGIVIPHDIKWLQGKYAKAPPAPKPPGILDRIGQGMAELGLRSDPVEPRPVGQRRGGLRAEVEPFVAQEPGEPAQEPESRAKPLGLGWSVLDQPGRAAEHGLSDPMLRPDFVASFRSEVLSGVRPEDRLDVLRTISQRGSGVHKRAADQILREVEAENSRVTLADEGRARDLLKNQGAPQKTRGAGRPDRGRMIAPDITPGIADVMDGASKADIAKRREVAGGLRRVDDLPQTAADRGGRAAALRGRSAAEVAGDLGVAFKQGLVLTQQVVANSIDPSSKWAKDLASDMQALDKEFTPQTQRQATEIANRLAGADGEVEKFGLMLAEFLTSPSVTLKELARQAPLMAAIIGTTVVGGAAGAGLARGAAAMAPRTLGVAEAISPGFVIGKGAQAGALAAGGAARAAAAGGDAAGQTFEYLNDKKKVPDELLLRNEDVLALLKEGKTLDEARTIVAKSKARIAQGLGSIVGVVFGGMGLDALIAKRLGGNVAKTSAKAAMSREAGGEMAEESLTQVAGNIGIRQVDPSRPLAEGTGEAAATALVTSIPMTAGAAAVARADVLRELFTPSGADDMAPTEVRASAIRRFDELAAAFGLSDAAASSIKKQAGAMPAGDVAGFFARAVDSLEKRGLFKRPVDEQGVDDLSRRMAASEETGEPTDEVQGETAADADQGAAVAPAGPGPDRATQHPQTGDFTGLDETIDTAAHQAATSPLNERAEPTDAQKEAGNYAKGHVRISGLDVSIENPKGSVRRSKADAAQPWQVTMPAHYGYIRGSTGADGDHVDLFVGDKGDNGAFWVINQTTPDGKAFDEHKIVTGVESAAAAIDLYRRSFSDGFGDKVFGSISTRMDAGQIKAILPDMARASAVHQPKIGPDVARQPDVAATAVSPAAPADVGRDQPGGSGRTVGSGAAEPGRVDLDSAAPAGRRESDSVAAAPAPEADPALTTPKTAEKGGAAPVAESHAPAPSEPGDGGAAPTQAGAAPAPRVIGKVGRTPKNAQDIELRANADGTWTPHLGKYAMLDFESGEPITLPADTTDAQAAKTIRDAGAVSTKDKFFGVKEDAEQTVAPARTSSDGSKAGDGVKGAADQPAQWAAAKSQPSTAELLAQADKRVDGLKALLKCLVL